MSLAKIVANEASKMHGIHHIEVHVDADKKNYIVKHKSDEYSSDRNMKDHVLKTKSALAAHIAKHLKGPGCNDTDMDGN